jgi:hypothetical protein
VDGLQNRRPERLRVQSAIAGTTGSPAIPAVTQAMVNLVVNAWDEKDDATSGMLMLHIAQSSLLKH